MNWKSLRERGIRRSRWRCGLGLWMMAGCGINLFGSAALAQGTEAERTFLAEIEQKPRKTVIAVFDMSGSMMQSLEGNPPVLPRAREFTLDLVNDALKDGDRFVLMTFDVSPRKLLDLTVAEANRAELRGAVPSESTLSNKRGTNIRWAHHEALKLLETDKNPARYIIVLSDGYHDDPAGNDPLYPYYVAYYVPGNLDRRPETPQSRDYWKLLQGIQQKQIGMFGVGVKIVNGEIREIPVPEMVEVAVCPKSGLLPGTYCPSEDIRKFERGQEPAERCTVCQPAVAPVPPANKGLPAWAVPAGIGAAVLAALAGAYMMLFNPIPVALAASGNSKSHLTFPLAHGGTVQLGGPGADKLDHAYPVPDTSEPAGAIRRSMGNFLLEPNAQMTSGSAKLALNGEPVNAATALRFGDEIKITVTDSAGVERDHRLQFDKPGAFTDEF